MKSKCGFGETGGVSLRVRTHLEVAKGVPRSIYSVPTWHFGTLLGFILEDLGD